MRSIKRNLVLFLVTGAGAGYVPLFPGTAGTLVGVPLSLGLNSMAASYPLLALLTLAAIVLGAIWLSAEAAEILRQKDPPVIVLDEIAGFLVANFLSPPRIAPLVLSFLLFRLFDIIKLFPASRLEKLPSGRGIVLDDVMAGIYTWIALRLIFWWDIL